MVYGGQAVGLNLTNTKNRLCARATPPQSGKPPNAMNQENNDLQWNRDIYHVLLVV